MKTLSSEDVEFFRENGYIKIEQMYSPDEVEEMGSELDYIMETFASWDAAWKGPWRKEYMDKEEDEQATLVAIHELQHYSAAWSRAVTKRELGSAIGDLLGSDSVELHHVTLHAKPPDKGAPFPMHQDLPFFPHVDNRYVDCLVHLNDADDNSGCIKFLAGSHKNGKLEHITGAGTAPHLPTEDYRLEDAVSVPARAGDVVLFTLWTIHGSAVNHSPDWRRLVRLGFRDPRNLQERGQAMGRPGLLVKGVRPKIKDVEVNVYGNWSNG